MSVETNNHFSKVVFYINLFGASINYIYSMYYAYNGYTMQCVNSLVLLIANVFAFMYVSESAFEDVSEIKEEERIIL